MRISISPETIFYIGNFAVTNTLFTSWLVVLFIIVLAVVIRRSISPVPGKFQSLVEIIIEKLYQFMSTFSEDKETVKKFFPLVATIFFFILISNWAGTLPGFETIGFNHMIDGKEEFVPIFRTVNSDLNVTLVLALIVVICSHIVGLLTIGPINHAKKFIVNPIKKPIGFFVGILEFVGEFSRIISLTFRLFGNIFAGSVLMLITSFLVPYIVPIPFLGLELFVGFIQAIIFSVLAMMFISSATKMHEEH